MHQARCAHRLGTPWAHLLSLLVGLSVSLDRGVDQAAVRACLAVDEALGDEHLEREPPGIVVALDAGLDRPRIGAFWVALDELRDVLHEPCRPERLVAA